MKFTCPCCGYKTLKRNPPGTFEICKICFWEDDNFQYKNPDFKRGSNESSLNEARKNFLKIGASCERFLKYVRKPTNKDKKDLSWNILGKSQK